MAKKGISTGPKHSKKNTSQLQTFDPKKTFLEMKPRELSEVLFGIWMDRDIESFKGVLSTYLEVHNQQNIARRMGVSRDTLYHMVSEEGHLTLETMFKLLDAIDREAA